ncbi:MAG: HNH endonuclease [Terriglobales bacterium]
MPTEIPKEFLARAKAVTAHRAKVVIDHILEHGSITTEELKDKYGYNHPPRAARDVREQGIPLKTFTAVGGDGRKIAAYRFDLDAAADAKKLGGRKAFPKITKDALLERDGSFCAVCGLEYESRYLQVDHCVPYEVAGESLSDDPDELMLVCGSCNRGKSWSCEHCENWKKTKDVKACQTCYWASPKSYQHMALEQIRRADIGWKGDEVKVYDKLRKASEKKGVSMQNLLKTIIKDSALLK